ncbi:efflux RND transporter periplasmic adaptor subunit [Alteromonas sp. 5E99-2]|uniref:efflux RND transporter periplasmic adaptor subunit n=1 Tax=Alteromonas sp. 5E99-2 TaxID=2817683 RepID=UPI001A997AD6|nr:efflux RND transporter periplasmic adaptor subunit [Alteromonas sp. 5E99-2]MBO1256348.1 efflux RND transporter periplasmic adaptor subunit [Alteromonas sp. 5E99-2]
MSIRFTFFVSFFLFLVACSSEEQTVPQTFHAPSVDVANPIETTVTSWDEYSGRFEAVEEVEIRARVTGYIESVNFEDGQFVNKNDILFVIDQRPFKIALDSASATFDLAQKELVRAKELREKKSISQEEVDERINAVRQAEADLASAELNMAFTEVRTPISGLVSRDLVNAGNLISDSNGTLLTTVVSINPIHFYFQAGETEFLKYMRASLSGDRESSRTASNPVRVKLQDESEYVHSGVMDFVDNRVDRSTGTIEGRAIFNNDDGFLLPGVFGRLKVLSSNKQNVLLIPDIALSTDQNRKYVYIVNKDSKIERKYVELGKLHNQDLRIITSGLQGNENIVVNGLMRIRDGVPVKPETVDLSKQYSF